MVIAILVVMGAILVVMFATNVSPTGTVCVVIAILVVMFATNVSPTGTDVRGDSYSGSYGGYSGSYVCNQCFTDWNICAW